MDRNNDCFCRSSCQFRVATREGGVDRNSGAKVPPGVSGVATREGGVDRNSAVLPSPLTVRPSPPARVAWIETPNRTP